MVFNIRIKKLKDKNVFFIVDKLSMKCITFTCKKSPTQKSVCKNPFDAVSFKKKTRQHLPDDKM